MPARPLLPGEDATSLSPAIAYGWSAIYHELVLVGEAQTSRLSRANAALATSATKEIRSIERRLTHQRSRAEFWRARAWRLQGLVLDHDRRQLSYQGASVKLTTRETQLLRVLLGAPDRIFSSRELLEGAWANSLLSAEALRNYVPRIRRKLASLQLADISNLAGRGYLLTFRDIVGVERGGANTFLPRTTRTLPPAIRPADTLLPGEELDAPGPAEVALWSGLYDQLVPLTAVLLKDACAAAVTDGRSNSPSQPSIIAIGRRLAHQEKRLVHWQQQHWELSGLCIDDETRTLSYCGENRRLTRREHQLLRYLIGVPDQFVSAQRLLNVAWPDAFATPDCLYKYVGRLRLLLAQMAIPCQIQNKPGTGYAVVRSATSNEAGD